MIDFIADQPHAFCMAPARNRLRDVAPPVLRLAWIGDESIAATDAPAVGGQSFYLKLIEGLEVHTSSFTSGASGGGNTTLLSGASGLTPSRRSDPSITLRNTGAATVPP